MRRAILPAAMLAAVSVAPSGAQPIIVSPSMEATAAPQLRSHCTTAPGGGGVTEVQCVMSQQASAARGRVPPPPARILIRAEIAPQQCAAGHPHVVDLPRRAPVTAPGLPRVVQEEPEANCAS